jgi:hypothetical protein
MRYAILSIGNGIAIPEALTVEIPDAHFDELDRAVGVRIKFVDCVQVEAHDAASLLVIERCAFGRSPSPLFSSAPHHRALPALWCPR